MEILSKGIFLDTSVINLIVEKGYLIFDGYNEKEFIPFRKRRDIYALYRIFLMALRIELPIVISKITFTEILETRDEQKRKELGNYSQQIWRYANLANSEPEISPRKITLLEEYLFETFNLQLLPDTIDKKLICEAIALHCDYFCTRDWKTILKYRERLKKLPIKFIAPYEWFELYQPYVSVII